MFVFIFGDNVVESRNKLLEFNRENYPTCEIVHLDDCSQERDFQEKTNTVGFFSTRQLFIFENFFKGKAAKWKTEINYEQLEKNENIFVFWEETLNVAGKKALSFTCKKNIFEFKIPNLLWNFLDGIAPCVGTQPASRLASIRRSGQGGHVVSLQNLRKILKSVDANYLFLMLVRQFRLLILTKEKFRDYPSDYKRLTFQKYKLAHQASFFKKEHLQDLYHQLLEIEVRQKTGSAIYDLKTEIEKFLMNI